uniref:Uncharacterized protein LOC123612811 n=1 Tax=Camelus bactrianus TaxID=9837 RepID=A0A9W3H8M9_CAMBA|nr:uncharacterized protein LOC123612811 [Camelus bactrianus]XP_045362621.1 uncharacterized protein LOC123612811 [Camelus bactrianus]
MHVAPHLQYTMLCPVQHPNCHRFGFHQSEELIIHLFHRGAVGWERPKQWPRVTQQEAAYLSTALPAGCRGDSPQSSVPAQSQQVLPGSGLAPDTPSSSTCQMKRGFKISSWSRGVTLLLRLHGCWGLPLERAGMGTRAGIQGLRTLRSGQGEWEGARLSLPAVLMGTEAPDRVVCPGPLGPGPALGVISPGTHWSLGSTCWAQTQLCHREARPREGASPPWACFFLGPCRGPGTLPSTRHTTKPAVASSQVFPRDPNTAPQPKPACGVGQTACLCGSLGCWGSRLPWRGCPWLGPGHVLSSLQGPPSVCPTWRTKMILKNASG